MYLVFYQISVSGQEDIEIGNQDKNNNNCHVNVVYAQKSCYGFDILVHTTLQRCLTIEDLAGAQTEDEDEHEEEHAEADSGADVRVLYLPPVVDFWDASGGRSCRRRRQRFWACWRWRQGFDRGRRSYRYDPGHSVRH